MKRYLERLINKENLTTKEMKQVTKQCLTGEVSDSEIASFLTALRAKGETANEITGIVEVIRSYSPLSSISINGVMDNCGTGGDQSNSFNISTTAAFVIAGAGFTVAKHGNRSISSKTGSADILEYLGVSLSFSKAQTEEMLYENNIAFLFAQNVHEKLKPFMKVRKQLGIPTIFNMIGPLTNPIELDTQLLGVYRRDLIPLLAKVLQSLSRKRAIVVCGPGNMDEASLAGNNHFMLLDHGELTEHTLHPDDVGLPIYPNEEIIGGNAKDNAKILLDVLSGKKGAYLDTVLLNAGLGLYVIGAADSISDSIEMARESIHSGAAMQKLQRLIEYSQKTSSGVI